MPRIRSISIVSIAIVCGTAFLLLVIFLTGTLTLFGRQPADFLPADSTIAVLHNVDDELINAYTPWLPVLDELSDDEKSGTIAIVQLESGSAALVRFTKEALATTPKSYWPYTVYTNADDAASLLQSRLQSLTKKPGYREFLRTKKSDQQWMYVQSDVIPSSHSYYTKLATTLLLQNAEQLSITHNKIELYRPAQHTGQSTLPNAPQENTIITADAWNARELLEDVLDDTVLASLVRQQLREIFGPSVSLEFDILPLLEGSITIDVSTSDDGNLLVQLSGIHNDAKNLKKMLTHLHDSRRAQLPNVELLEMQLDKQFRMRTLRNSPSTPEVTDLFTAQQGSSFTITNHESLLFEPEPQSRRLTSNANRLTVPKSSFLFTSNRRSTGWINRKAFRSILDEMLVDDVDADLPFLPTDSAELLWLWEERGPLTIITFTGQEP